MICVNDKGGKTSPFFTFPEIEKVDIHAKLTTQNVPLRPTTALGATSPLRISFTQKRNISSSEMKNVSPRVETLNVLFCFFELKTMRFFKNEATT